MTHRYAIQVLVAAEELAGACLDVAEAQMPSNFAAPWQPEVVHARRPAEGAVRPQQGLTSAHKKYISTCHLSMRLPQKHL